MNDETGKENRMILHAIKHGIEEGVYNAFAEHIEQLGDCYDEPQDRCVMRPKDGCACLYARWQRLPWYKRVFLKRPEKPSVKAVSEAAIGLLVGEAISDARIKKMKQERKAT